MGKQDKQERDLLGQWPSVEHTYTQFYFLHVIFAPQEQSIDLTEIVTLLSAHAVSKLIITCYAGVRLFLSCKALKTSRLLNIEIHAHADSQIKLLWQQENTENMSESSSIRGSFFLAKHASLKTVFVVTQKNRFTKIETETFLLEPYAQAHMTTVHSLSKEQRYSLSCSHIHRAPHTTSTLTTHGVVKEHARSFCKGIVQINGSADYSDAQQYTKQMAFGPFVKIVNLPVLEVETKKVRCKHGSAVGSLHKEDIWFLTSKGLDVNVAETLCTEAFLRSSLEASGVVSDSEIIMDALRDR